MISCGVLIQLDASVVPCMLGYCAKVCLLTIGGDDPLNHPTIGVTLQ
jgi:hypothetical protein